MVSKSKLGLVFASLLALGAWPLGCSSSSGGSGTPPGIYCNVPSTVSPLCYGYSNLTPDQQSSVSQACTGSLMGTIASSCPDGDIGCCSMMTGQYTTTECYYAGDPASFESGCKAANGTWTAGSGGDGGTTEGGGGDSGTSDSAADSGKGSKDSGASDAKKKG